MALVHRRMQVGASCQTLNGSLASTGVVSMDFSVRYGALPFTIVELYTPRDLPGLYTKRASEPGGRLLQLASVVVDITSETLIIFSCLDLSPFPPITELVIASQRIPASGANVTDALIARAHMLGVPFSDRDVKRVDHASCPSK